ncbi:MAG TPA: nucleoside triphosphate pyrophosphohydrolase [Gammaproteobacteria bacterium]
MDQVKRLLEIMAALRDPETGCPWDLRQNFDTIAPYTLEEAYEVCDAIARRDYGELREELGDLLLQVVFHSQMAAEEGHFTFEEVVRAINEKMVRRHPHVFKRNDGQQGESVSMDTIKRFWEEEKARERSRKETHGLLEGVALALPALKRAQKLQKRAAGVNFDWKDIAGVIDKLQEELDEFSQALRKKNQQALDEELGDLLFTCVNLARHISADAEDCLRQANRKFERRFARMEVRLRDRGTRLEDCTPDELDALWNMAKRDEE